MPNPSSIGEGIGIYNVIELIRTPVIFKTLNTAATGPTNIWTPVAGKKFRLQKYSIYISSNATYSGDTDIFVQFRDQALSLTQFRHRFRIPGVAANHLGGYISGQSLEFKLFRPAKWIDLGNGYLSTTINNSLRVELSVPLSTGFVRVNVCGTEE